MIPRALLAAVVVLGGGSGALGGLADEPREPRLALVAAAGRWRPVQARLSGGFAYAALRTGEAPSGPADLVAFTLAAARITSKAARNPNEISLADLGVVSLLQGQPHQAVANLEKALAASSQDEANLLSDLAAAYLTRAVSLDRAHDLIRALDTLERALAVSPFLHEALFNRALTLERLGLRSAAAHTWSEYLAADAASGWAEEARGRRQGLSAVTEPDRWAGQRRGLEEAVARGDVVAVEAAVRRSPSFARRDALEFSLPGWAGASAERRPREASNFLAVARAIGEALARAQADEFVRNVVAEIDRATRGGAAPGRRSALLSGHQALDAGRSLLAESRLEEGVARLRQAETDFGAAGSPMALRARCLLAKAAYVQARYEDGLKLAEAVRREAGRLPYPALRAESARWVGLIGSVLGRPAEAIEAYRAALADLEAAGSRDDVAAVKSLLAENLATLGEDEEAWALRVDALRAAEPFQGTGGTYNIAFEAADAAVATGHPRAALPLLDAAVRAAEASGNRVALFEILVERSTARDRVGRFADAVGDRARARGVVATLNDGRLMSRLQTESLLSEGELQASREPSVAIGLLSKAESSLEEIRRFYLLPRLYRALARAYREVGQVQESAAYLGKAILAGEDQSSWAPAAAASRRDPQRETLADMVRLQFLGLRNPAGALDYAERTRTWRLRGLLAASRGQAILRTSWRNSAACGSRIVDGRRRDWARIEYFILGDRILTWLLTADGLSSAQPLVSDADVREWVGDVHSTAEQGSRGDDLDPKLERLYDLLIRPVRHLIPERASVFFVPDSALEAVPFGALRNRDTGRYLIEDHEVAVTSSVDCPMESEPPGPTSRRGSGTLVVGDPPVDARAFPWLAPLSGAAREARAVAERYPGSRLLLGEHATKGRFLRDAAGARIVHYAGHALGNQDRPEFSMLVFAPEGIAEPDSGVLYARDVAASDLTGLDLVVLSACGTGLGSHHGPVGLGGLAWSFLASGVGQVVTAVWRIDDRATSDFMIDFHRHLGGGADAAAALRGVQLEWIHHADRNRRAPALWSGFSLVVSHATRDRRGKSVVANQP